MIGWDEWSAQSTAVSHYHHLIINLQEVSCMKELQLLLLENNTWKTMKRWIIFPGGTVPVSVDKAFLGSYLKVMTVLFAIFLNILFSLELIVQYKTIAVTEKSSYLFQLSNH